VASIPSKRKVERALKDTERATHNVVKEANRAAGRQISQGDYVGSEKYVVLAKAASNFCTEVAALRQRWRDLAAESRSRKAGAESAKTPLWQFYQPILKALHSLGGKATRRELEKQLETYLDGTLKDGDLTGNIRGTPRWKIMVRRSRRAMIKEKFLEDGTGKTWVMAPAGQRALEEKKAPA